MFLFQKMLRRFSKKNKNPPDGGSSSSSNNNEETTRKQKKLLAKFLEFITSSIWSIPIASFIESQSVVFDRQQMETEIYVEIHKEYSRLIDTLIECFCDDVGTTPSELVEAIRLFNQKDVSQKYKVALEPLLAAQNFNVFVPMMMRKNIELQLQALQMIEFMCGLIPSVLQLEDGETLRNMKKLTPEETERYVLISVLRHSKDEYDALHKGSEQMEQMARNSRFQREALELEIQREEFLLQKALNEGVKNQNQAASTQTTSAAEAGTSSLRSVAAIMAATFSIDTGTSTDDIRVELMDEPKKTTSNFGTMTASTGVDMGTDAADMEKERGSRPKSAKRVGSAVGKRSGSASKATSDGAAGTDEVGKTEDGEAQKIREKRPSTSSKKSTTMVNSESNTDDLKRPGTGSKISKNSTGTQMAADISTEAGEQEKLPGTSSKSSKKSSAEGSPDSDGKEKTKEKRPRTAKGPNERKYSNAGLEDIVGAQKPGPEDSKTDSKSRPSTRKSTRTGEESSSRPPSRKTTTSHEPRAKTPLQKNSEDRPTTRRSSVDKNAPKRNDSVPRERRSSTSQKDEDRKPPKPMGPVRGNKYDGDVVMGRPGSPGMDHGPRRKNLNDVNSQLVDHNRLNSSDVRIRAQYLREQRDKLVQKKNEERKKQMNDIQQNSLERPKTAARAREILDKDKKEAEAIRKEISDKLKADILTLHK